MLSPKIDSELSNQFLELKFVARDMPQFHASMRHGTPANDSISEDVVEHAKVAVFADKWSVSDLEAVALYE